MWVKLAITRERSFSLLIHESKSKRSWLEAYRSCQFLLYCNRWSVTAGIHTHRHTHTQSALPYPSCSYASRHNNYRLVRIENGVNHQQYARWRNLRLPILAQHLYWDQNFVHRTFPQLLSAELRTKYAIDNYTCRSIRLYTSVKIQILAYFECSTKGHLFWALAHMYTDLFRYGPGFSPVFSKHGSPAQYREKWVKSHA